MRLQEISNLRELTPQATGLCFALCHNEGDKAESGLKKIIHERIVLMNYFVLFRIPKRTYSLLCKANNMAR